MLDYNAYINQLMSYKKLESDAKLNRMAHTFLILSKDSDLGFSYAKKLSKIIVANDNKLFESKIDKDIHPDVKIYGNQKKFTADEASEIVLDVLVMPYEADKKVYILANAENMNEESQNKLLKTLEEPPENSYFILSAKSEKTLLQTVISRSKKIIVEEPNEEKIEELLINAGVLAPQAKIASICSGKDASKAFKMASDSGFIKLYDNVFDMFRLMNSSKDIIKFIARFSSRDFVIQDFLTIVESVAMDVVYILSGSDKLILNKHRIPELKIISSSFSVLALSKILKECFDFRESLYYNVSMTPALDGFLLKFVEVKVKCKKSLA